MDYFRNVFPNAYAWRFHRKKLKAGLISGSFTSKIVRSLFEVYKIVKEKKPDFEIDQEQIMNYYYEEKEKILNIKQVVDIDCDPYSLLASKSKSELLAGLKCNEGH